MRKLHISKNALLATRRLGKVCLACGLLLALAACSSSDPADSLPDTTDTTDGDADTSEQEKADGETLVGTFVVSLTAPLAASGTQSASEGKASFSGVVNDGPTPVGTLFEAFQTVGACTLYKPRVPFCESACLNGAVCVEDDTCLAYPNALALGTLSVSGLTLATGGTSFTLAPVNNLYQAAGSSKLAYPPFAEGGAVTLSLPGNERVAAFTLNGQGISPLVLTGSAYDLAKDTPFALSWTPAGTNVGSKIHVKLDISHHGGTKGKIECDTADTGALSIDKSLITTLLNLGVAGFPSVIVTRQAQSATTTGAGRVQLEINATVEHDVNVAGLSSRNADEDCDDGKTCQDNLTCG